MSLAIGLWTDALIRDLFSRADWLGWLAAGAPRRSPRCRWSSSWPANCSRWRGSPRSKRSGSARSTPSPATTPRRRAPWSTNCRCSSPPSRRPRPAAARSPICAARSSTAPIWSASPRPRSWRRSTPQAKVLILDAAKRVSLVTAVSPRALVDVAYVVFEAGRLIRRLAELYGGRPGTLGFFRLARDVLAHLAVTGSIAVGDSFVQQIVGHGLAARLSAKLGEGVVNGMMTARIGIAAMETARPLPFSAVKRPGHGRFPVGADGVRDPQGAAGNHVGRIGLRPRRGASIVARHRRRINQSSSRFGAFPLVAFGSRVPLMIRALLSVFLPLSAAVTANAPGDARGRRTRRAASSNRSRASGPVRARSSPASTRAPSSSAISPARRRPARSA